MAFRRIVRQHQAFRDDIGDLVTRRPLPGPALAHLDPFLFLNHHGPQVYPPGNRGLPFGPHPHRGFETVTFILSGELAHRDSGGHESVIHAGGAQWMTAGAGLVHSELSPASFMRTGGPLEILQLWVNLPARLKMAKPAYIGLEASDLAAIRGSDDRVTVELVSGTLDGRAGPIQSLTDIHLMVVKAKAGGAIDLPVAPGRAVFLYVVGGDITVDGAPASAQHLIELDQEGDAVRIAATSDAVALFGHGLAYGEPIVSHGPFVMNTREEIVRAIEDYQAGRFPGL
ncbi:MAG: pirin family protein [Caulobacteraceae bacterium]